MTRTDVGQRGFTLIELAVIVLIVTIIIAAIGINLTRSDRDRVRDEAERLAVLVQAARDEAVLQGRVLVLELTAEGYRFLQLADDGKLTVAGAGDLLAPRELPAPITASADFEGSNAARKAGLVFDPTGGLGPFLVTLRLNGTEWFVHNLLDGEIRASPEVPRHAG